MGTGSSHKYCYWSLAFHLLYTFFCCKRSSHAVFHYVDGLTYCPYPSEESSVGKLSFLTHWNGLRFGFVPFQPVTFQQPVPFHFDVAGALIYVDSMNYFEATFCLQLRMTHLMIFLSIRSRKVVAFNLSLSCMHVLLKNVLCNDYDSTNVNCRYADLKKKMLSLDKNKIKNQNQKPKKN